MSKFKGLIFNVAPMRTGGAHRIATHLRDSGWDIEILDFVYFFNLEELKAFAVSRIDKNTKFIGFSTLFNHWPDIVLEFLDWLKTAYPDIVIINGSPVYDGIRDERIDYYIAGWAEIALIKLLKYLFSNGEKPIFVENDKVILAHKHYSAAPNFNPIITYEDRDYIQPDEWGSIEFSRGCKFACKFCAFPLLGVQDDYSRTAESFEKQVRDNYDRFGVTKYVVSDDTFNDRPEKIKKYADVVETLEFKPYFSGFIRPDLIVARPSDREDLLRMGFIGHWYGVESLNSASAKSIGKGMPSEKLKEGLLSVKEYFYSHGSGLYRGTMSLIAGLPHETFETLENTKRWLVDYWSGENFMYYPLHISGDSDEYGDKSYISQDYEKFGYKKINFDYLDKKGKVFRIKSSLMWENENMNFIDAVEFANEMQDLLSCGKFRIGSFFMTYLPMQIQEVIKLRVDSTNYHQNFFNQGPELELITAFVRKYYNLKMRIV